jgi:hypothetical protein
MSKRRLGEKKRGRARKVKMSFETQHGFFGCADKKCRCRTMSQQPMSRIPLGPLRWE